MADEVLSQSEIDKLLSALSEGSVDTEELKNEESQKKVKAYDFKRPDKFSKDQIRTLYMLHESFARLLNTYLSTHLRTMVSIDVASVEQLTYQEFVQSLANPSVISILAVPPLKGNIIVEVNTEIAFAFIDRVFGGAGKSGVKVRVLTEIEEAVMKRFVETAVGHLKEAWSNVVEFFPTIEATESNPQFTQSYYHCSNETGRCGGHDEHLHSISGTGAHYVKAHHDFLGSCFCSEGQQSPAGGAFAAKDRAYRSACCSRNGAHRYFHSRVLDLGLRRCSAAGH